MSEYHSNELLQINIDAILRKRMSTKAARLFPRCFTRLLERIVCQNELNEILQAVHPACGSDFSNQVLSYLNITVNVEGLANLQTNGRYIFASNHPLGGLDGITLIAVLGRIYGDENLSFLVNDLLMNITPLKNVFLPINKYGGQGRNAAKAISDAYNSPDKQILIFPAGLVSRKGKCGLISDLEWKKTFVQKALNAEREIVPIHFIGNNSACFYNLAKLRTKMRIPVNIEQVLLPSELIKAAGSRFDIRIGTPVSLSDLRLLAKEKGVASVAAYIKEICYNLK